MTLEELKQFKREWSRAVATYDRLDAELARVGNERRLAYDAASQAKAEYDRALAAYGDGL